MSEPAQKYENYAIFKQNYTPELLIALEMVYSCFFGLRGFSRFPPKKVYNINSRPPFGPPWTQGQGRGCPNTLSNY